MTRFWPVICDLKKSQIRIKKPQGTSIEDTRSDEPENSRGHPRRWDSLNVARWYKKDLCGSLSSRASSELKKKTLARAKGGGTTVNPLTLSSRVLTSLFRFSLLSCLHRRFRVSPGRFFFILPCTFDSCACAHASLSLQFFFPLVTNTERRFCMSARLYTFLRYLKGERLASFSPNSPSPVRVAAAVAQSHKKRRRVALAHSTLEGRVVRETHTRALIRKNSLLHLAACASSWLLK